MKSLKEKQGIFEGLELPINCSACNKWQECKIDKKRCKYTKIYKDKAEQRVDLAVVEFCKLLNEKERRLEKLSDDYKQVPNVYFIMLMQIREIKLRFNELFIFEKQSSVKEEGVKR